MDARGSAASTGNTQMDSAKVQVKIKVRPDIVRIITPRADTSLDAADKAFTAIVLSGTFPPFSYGEEL
jgi:hypothetical protein